MNAQTPMQIVQAAAMLDRTEAGANSIDPAASTHANNRVDVLTAESREVFRIVENVKT